jgi:energy-coupling factor transport system permease protein
MAFAFSTALRLVPTFAGAGATIVQAQISRGLNLESGGPVARLRRFIPLSVPLFIYAIRHTNMLAMALESKGFRPEQKRTFYLELRMTPGDYAVLIFLVLLITALLILRLQGYGVVMPGRM